MNVVRSGNQIIVEGLVDTVKVSEDVGSEAESVVKSSGGGEIILIFKDTFVIPSALIGTLLSLVQREGANISVRIGNQELYELLEKLNLIKALNVRKL